MKRGKISRPHFTGALAVWVAVALLALLQALQGFDGLEVSFGRLMIVYWLGLAAWLVCLIHALWTARLWWLLLTAPIALYPVAIPTLLLAACMQGNCI